MPTVFLCKIHVRILRIVSSSQHSLSEDFHSRLDALLKVLIHSRPHFIRCLKVGAIGSLLHPNNNFIYIAARAEYTVYHSGHYLMYGLDITVSEFFLVNRSSLSRYVNHVGKSLV